MDSKKPSHSEPSAAGDRNNTAGAAELETNIPFVTTVNANSDTVEPGINSRRTDDATRVSTSSTTPPRRTRHGSRKTSQAKSKQQRVRHQEDVDLASSLKPPRRKVVSEKQGGESSSTKKPPSPGLSPQDAKMKEKAKMAVAAGDDLSHGPAEVPWKLPTESQQLVENVNQGMHDTKLEEKISKNKSMPGNKDYPELSFEDVDMTRGMIDIEDVDSQISSTQKSQGQTELRPGAVPMPGVGGDNPFPQDADTSPFDRPRSAQDQAQDEMSDGKEHGADSDMHLINAVLVEPEQQQQPSTAPADIPYAEATAFVEEPPGRNKKLYYMLGLVAVLVVIGVVVVVVVVVTGKSDGDSAPDNLVDATVVIRLDDEPQQTGWDLTCGAFVSASVPPGTYTGLNNRLVTVNTEIALGEECQFSITDAGANGITGGLFELYTGRDINNEDARLVEGSGDFTDARTVAFKAVAPPTITPTASPAPTQSLSPTSSEGLATIMVEIQLDKFPAETGWSLWCNDVEYMSVPTRSYSIQSSLVSEVVEVDSGAGCEFNLVDDFGDGICCENGQGYYRLYLGTSRTILLAEGGEFDFQEEVLFVAAPPEPTVSPAPTTVAPTKMPVVQTTQQPATAPPVDTPGVPCETNAECNGGVCVNDNCVSSLVANLGACDHDSDCQNSVCALENFSPNAQLACCPNGERYISSSNIPWSSSSLYFCQFQQPANEPCAENSLCQSGHCVNNVCTKDIVANLGACDDDSDCESSICAFENFTQAAQRVCCPSGEVFVSSSDILWSTRSQYFCQLQQPSGEACAANSLCQSGHCVNGACADTAVANLGACDDDSDCESNICAYGNFSQAAELVCCPNGEVYVSSSGISWSSSSRYFCQQLVPAGDPCGVNSICQSGQCVQGTCVGAAVAELEACDDNSDCQGNICALGNFSAEAEKICCPNDDVYITSSSIPWSTSSLNFCRFQQSTGAPCVANSLCQSGHCVNGACTNSSVADLGACDDDSDCDSSTCAYDRFTESAGLVCCPNGDSYITSSNIPWSTSSLSFCQLLVPAGEPCAVNSLCQSGQCVQGTCINASAADLESCDDDSDCQSSSCGYGNFSEAADLVCCPSGASYITSSNIPWSSSSRDFCNSLVVAGAPCAQNSLCQSGQCVQGTCINAAAADLESCDDDSDCQSASCGYGNFSEAAELVCCPNGANYITSSNIPWSSSSRYFCKSLVVAGAPCAQNSLCQSGHCVGGACTASAVANLGACDDDSDCQSSSCGYDNFSEAAELVCCPNGANYITSSNIPWSSSSLYFCKSLVVAGAPCAQNSLCQSGQCVNGACTASAVANLGACDDDSDCQSSSCGYGNFSEAAELVCCPSGASYITSSSIPWSSSSRYFCQSLIAAGAPCAQNSLCQSGQCVNGACTAL